MAATVGSCQGSRIKHRHCCAAHCGSSAPVRRLCRSRRIFCREAISALAERRTPPVASFRTPACGETRGCGHRAEAPGTLQHTCEQRVACSLLCRIGKVRAHPARVEFVGLEHPGLLRALPGCGKQASGVNRIGEGVPYSLPPAAPSPATISKLPATRLWE